ncbi:MAG: metallophosphoesterase [Anaeroplasmataceae bacterium]|nr:metallophosphoesterase [Anaeroplasmataceae bacterium]
MRIAMLIVSAILYCIIWIILTKQVVKAFQVEEKKTIFICIVLVGMIPLFCVIDYIWRGIGFVEWMAYAGYMILAFFIYYVLSLAFVLFIKKIIGWIKKTKRILISRSAIFIATGMSLGLCLWGIIAAQIPEYTYQKIDLGLDEDLKITVVSDIHFGATGSLLSLERMVDHINKTNPDLVFMVGDVFDNQIKNLDHAFFVETMNKISSTYGTYAVTGNHEFIGNSLEEIKNFYEGSNIHLLLDEEVVLKDMLRIVGRIDYRGGRKELSEIISDSELPLIVLDHQPQYYRDAKELADLQISGHTHNGQIFPGEILVFLLNQIVYKSPSDGVHTYNDFTLAITRGYGTWGFPMRLTGPSQIMIFEI